MAGALGELHAIALAQGLEPAGVSGGMYAGSIFQHGRGQATVFIPTNATPRAIGHVERFTVPAAELAIMAHHGSLASADLTYGRLATHVIRHEVSVEGPLREYYLAGFLDTEDPNSWETEIGWPIFRLTGTAQLRQGDSLEASKAARSEAPDRSAVTAEPCRSHLRRLLPSLSRGKALARIG